MKTDSLEALFIETPLMVGAKPKPLKVAKTRHNPFQGVSSWAILRELLSRNYINMQVFGFWVLIAIIVWVQLGR